MFIRTTAFIRARFSAAPFRSFYMLPALFLMLSCSQNPEPIFRIATNVWPGYEPLYLARSLGRFENSSIRLVEMPSASQVSHAMRNRTVEAAALTLDETLTLLQEGNLDMRVVLVMDISNGADVLLGNADIANLQSLRGKRIGVENTATGAVVLAAALRSAGLSAKDIIVAPKTVNDHLAAWKNREFDAVVTFEPVRSQLLNSGAHELFDSSQIPGTIMDVLVVRADALEKHQSAIRTLIAGYFTGIDYISTHPEDAAQRMARRLATDAALVMPQFTGLKLPTTEENRRWLATAEPNLNKAAADLAKLMYEQQLLQTEVNTDRLAEPKFLPPNP